MKFDIDSARKAGYSDDEIADYLATQNKFDLSGAIESGYTARDVIDFLAKPAANPQRDLPADIKPSEGRSTDFAATDPRRVDRQQPGLIQRVADFLKPAPKSVLEGYVPTAEERQAEVDRRLSYGAGPISSQTAAQADLVRSGMAKTDSPTVKRVAKAMDEQGTKSIGDLVAAAQNPVNQRAARDAKAEEFRTPGEWAVDLLSNVSQGAVGLFQLPVNIIAPSSEIAQTLRDTQKELQAAESDVLRANREQLKERVLTEEGFFDRYVATVKELVTNPTLTIAEAAKQVPNFLGVVGAARLAGAATGGAVSLAGRASPTLALGEAISGGAIQTAARAAGTTAGGAGASMVMAGGDAAGNVYETLTDRNRTPISVWKQNPDFQKLVADGKSEKQAIEEIATTKARMAALITAPLGLLGYAGAEAAIASKGLGRATAEALTARGMAKTAAKDLGGEQLEEGGTQFGGNVLARTVNPNQSLTEGVPEAMGTALVTSAPFTVAGIRSQYKEAMQGNEDQTIAARVGDMIIGQERQDPRLVNPMDTIRGADQIGPSAPARAPQVMNFTEPNSATAQAGLTPIVVPLPTNTETTNVGTTGVAGPAIAGSGQLAGDLSGAGLGDAGLAGVNAAGAPRAGAAGVAPLGGEAAPVGGGAGQRAAAVGLPRPLPRATDADLLSRTEAAVAAQENNNAVVGELVEPWFGRKGDGYVTEGDAQQALPGRQRKFPTLEWKIQQMPNGKFMLAGYTKETASGNQAPQAQQGQAQGAQAPAASASPAAAAIDFSLPQGPLSDADVARLGGNPDAPAVRADAQQALNNWASRSGTEAPQLGTPDADAETTVNVLGNLFGEATGIGPRVVAYSNPGGENGFAYRGVAFVNTAPDTDVAAPRTTLHEIKHVTERMAEADTRAGLTNTPAQRFVAQIDSIFDDITDEGKRAYVEKFLHKEELDGIADPAAREARVQELLKAPLLRSEMTADFLGNRATDRAFLIDLAKTDPKGFEGFVKKWLSVIDNLIGKLRGSKTQDRKESAKVDQYVRDLNKAKMVARDALIEFRKGNIGQQLQVATDGAPAASIRSRVDMNFKDVIKRTPELQAAAEKVKSGEMTAAEYDKLVNEYKPVAPYKSVPAPATVSDIRTALTSDKTERIGKASSLPAGHPVGLRLDIPAYANHGTWVVSVHEQEAGYNAGKSIGYEPVAAATNVTFGVVEKAAMNIASGKPKATIAVMKGSWKPTTAKQAYTAAQAALKSKDWVQVGMDPERHSYFYDRETMEPVVSAEEVLQIGPLVLAKKPVFGDKADFMFSRRSNEEAATESEADVMPPKAITADGIKFSLKQIEEINDAPEITMQDLVNETVFPILADLTAAGYMYMGKELRGGPYYTLLPSNTKAGLIWANDGKGVASIKNKKAARGVIGLIVAMKQDSHATNNTVANIIFRAVEDEIQKGSVAKDDVPKLDEIVRGLANRKTKNKKTGEMEPIFPKFAEFPGFSDRAGSEKFLREMPFEARGLFFEEMTKPTVEDLGLGVIRKVINDTVEPDLRGLNMGDVVMAIRFDPNAETIELGEKTGTPEHDSYRYAVKGEVIGKFKRPISFQNVFVDLMEERRAAGETNVARDYRSLTLRKPEQLITQEIADRITNEPYKTFKSPAEAKAAVASASMEWSVIDRPAGAGVKEFLRTSRIYGDGSKQWTFDEAKALIKEGKLRIVRLGQTENWFAIESRGNKRVMTHIMVAQPGVRRETMFADMVYQAAANGATHLEVGGVEAEIKEQRNETRERPVAPIIEELSAMSDADLVNLGINPKEINRLNGLIEEDGADQFSPTSLLMYSKRQGSPADRIKWRRVSDVKAEIGGLDTLPRHIIPFANFMQTMADKAANSGLTARDLIKAYTIARSSMNRSAVTTQKVKDAGLVLPENFTDEKIRPEGAFGYWLLSPMGQDYLNAAEVAIVNEVAVADAVKVMAPFGTQNALGKDLERAASGDLHTRLPGMTAAIAKAAKGKNAVKDWQDATDNLFGVREAKKGFLGSLLGFGQLPTFDARQINVNVDKESKEDTLRALSSVKARDVVAKLAKRMDALSLTMDPKFAPFYRHLVHHAVWDAVGGTETTHEDVMDSMLRASKRQDMESVEKPSFYSQLERVIANVPAKLATQPAKQWALWLDSNAPKLGVKKDEIEWSGIKDYLTLRGNEKVSKDDLAAYLKDGGVKVEESFRSSEIDEDALYDEVAQEIYSEDFYDLEWYEKDDVKTEVNKRMQQATLYGQYTLPGGENYRELLLRLPAFQNEERLQRAEADMAKALERKDIGMQLAYGPPLERLRAEKAKFVETFKSAHWDDKNVVAHIRINDRADADGNKVLFVEEVQSDWGQEGKKKGFGTPGIPSAPFVTKTEGWLNLALKRIAMLAVEEGYDKVAFVNGEQSADRYNLAKQVSSLSYEPGSGENSEGLLQAFDLKRQLVMSEMVRPTSVEDYVGKEVAQRLLASDKVMGKHLLEGENLKVGGDGMKTFYDQIVPQALNKLLPKLGGEKLATVEMPESANAFGAEDLAQPGFDVTDKMRETVGQGLPLFSKRSSAEMFDPAEIEKNRTPEYKSRTKLIELPINDFLALSDEGNTNYKTEGVQKLMKDGAKFSSLPFLIIDNNGRVEGHEGRHRARALKQAGYTTMPVILRSANIRWSEQYSPDQFDYVENWPTQIKAQNDAADPDFAIPFPVTREDSDKAYDGDSEDVMFSARQTDTPAFKRWFGDSKVVDDDGQPLLMYTGTSKDKDFTKFNIPKNGAWFTSSPEEASMYAKENDSMGFKWEGIRPIATNTASRVMPVYLRIENPATLSDEDMQSMRMAGNYKRVQGQIFDRLRAEGYDGVDLGGGVWVVIKDAKQIKSAIGNQGTFDPANADIRRSLRQNPNKRQKLIGTSFTMDSSSATDAARIKLQDDALRMKRVIEAVKAKGGKVTESQNFYDANTLMPGRIQAAIDDFKTDVVKPMLDKAAEYGIDMDELAAYAYAKHAKERNAYIASINKRMPDGGSGMTNDEADNIMQMVDLAGDKAKFEELHQMLMGITSATRQIMLAEGLITQDEFNQLEGAYDNYIPLRGFENVDEETGVARPGIGRGINVRGGETVRALGRKSKAGDLIENVIRDYERVIMRVEKNDVGKVLLDFVLSNPDPDLWGVDVERNKAAFNKTLGTVQYTKQVEKGEDTIGIKVGGQQVYIKFADKELARALRQAWKDETSGLERATLAMTGWWNNWMRAVLTKYNPAFAAINIPRDALWSGTAAALDDLGVRGLGLYLKNYGKALMASSRQELGLSGSGNPVFGNPQVDRMFQEFRAAGGITGGFYMRSLNDINQELRNELLLAGASARNPWEAIKSLPPFKLAKLTLKTLEFMGAASENATRFALYMTSREMGNTPTKAALLAKDGTTNFNRKGEWGGALNNLYLFFNAAVQGNAQLFKVLKNPKVQAAMAGVSGVGMMLALYGATAGGEDDDGEKYWDKIPSYVKERNLVIMLPPGGPLADGIERVGQRGRYVTIPVQYGFNIFPNLGYMLADVLRNAEDKRRGVTPTKAALHMTSVVLGSINPFGGAVDVTDGVQVLLAVSPTLTDLPIQLVNERGTFGSPSAPAKSPWDKRPDSERMFVSQQDTVSARIAKAINELGGGNEAKAGNIMGVETSVTPGTIQTLISATTGGLGSFVEQIGTSVSAMTGDDKDLKANKIPFVNKFYGEVDDAANVRSAAERMAQIRKLSDEVKAQQKVGIDPELKDDERKLMALAGMQESYQKQQAQIRKAELEIIKDTKMTDAEKTLERRKLQVEKDKLATEVNRVYLQATK